MAQMSLDTAIRLSAEVKGGGNIDRVKRSIQDLAQSSKTTAKDMDTLRSATFQFARANDGTIAGIKSSIGAFRGLQEQAKIGSREFQRYGAEIQKLEAKLRGIDGAAQKAGQSMGQQIAAGVASAAGAIGGALASFNIAGNVAKNTLALEEQSRRLRVMTNDSGALQAGIIALVREQGHLVSTTEASAAAYDILQAGFSNSSDILKLVRASTLGAVGGFTDMVTVSDALTSILNGYGMSAASAARVVDQMKVVTDDGKISMEAYAQSIGRVIPSAAAAKLPLEQVNAAISALTAQGVPVESTFSGINQVIKTILKPTQEAKDLAKSLGLEFNAQALAAKGLGGFLQDVGAKTGKSADALGILFSDIDGYKAVVGLLNDDLKRFNAFTENQATALGTAADAAQKGVDPLKQLDNAWKDLTSTIGQAALPGVAAAVSQLTDSIRVGIQFVEDYKTGWDLIGTAASNAIAPFSGVLNVLGQIDNRLRSIVQNPALGWLAGVAGGPLGPLLNAPAQLGANARNSQASRPQSGGYVSRFAGARDAAFAAAQQITGAPPPRALPPPSSSSSTGGGRAGTGSSTNEVKKGVKQLLRLTDAEITAAVNTAIGEYGGPDPRGRTDVFANILARSRSGQYPSNLVDVVMQPGQYAPNSRRSRAQVTNPNLYGKSRFEQVRAELMNAQMLAQSIQDIDSRLFFKGVSQQRNMVRGVDFLRAPDQNFFHGPGRSNPGRNPRITTKLLSELGDTSAVTGYLDKQADAAEKLREQEQRIASIVRERSAEISLMGIKVNMEEKIADAQTQGDKLLERRLEGQQRQIDIQTEYAKLLADPANQDIRIQEILTTQGLIALKAEEVRTERELQAIERERADEQRKSTPGFILGEAYDQSVKKLKDLTNAGNILSASADSIGSAFGSAFRDLITGATSASEALGRMFQSIADSFADMAAQMIAEWIKMQILGIVKSIFGAVAGGFSFGGSSGGFNLSGFEMPGYMAGTSIPSGFASGAAFDRGIVDSPTLFKFANGGAMRTGLMGEAGPEAILPLKRGVNGQLGVQMVGPAQQFAANRAALDGSTTGSSTSTTLAESRQALATAETSIRNRQADRSIEQAFSAPSQALKIQYDSQVINNVEYVTSDQFERGISQAAERGRALTLGALKNSVKARRQVGI